jgi:hypothetical protein
LKKVLKRVMTKDKEMDLRKKSLMIRMIMLLKGKLLRKKPKLRQKLLKGLLLLRRKREVRRGMKGLQRLRKTRLSNLLKEQSPEPPSQKVMSLKLILVAML